MDTTNLQCDQEAKWSKYSHRSVWPTQAGARQTEVAAKTNRNTGDRIVLEKSKKV